MNQTVMIGWVYIMVPFILLSMGLAILGAIIAGFKQLWFKFLGEIIFIISSPMTWIIIGTIYLIIIRRNVW